MDSILWRGLSFDNQYSKSLCEMKREIIEIGDNKKDKFNLLVPNISHHRNDPQNILNGIINLHLPIARYESLTAKCVTSDVGSAKIYATRENEPGIVIKLNIKTDLLVIDGRDFLYSIFPRIIKKEAKEGKIKLLSEIFGKKINLYITEGEKLKDYDSQYIFKYIDYICMDLDIIEAHINNVILINGRYSTRFTNAFGVIGGIQPQDVLEVIFANQISNNIPDVEINISDF